VTSLMSQRFVAVVAAIRSALHLPALSRMSKQRNLNAEEFALREAADLVILEAWAESPDRVASAFAKVLSAAEPKAAIPPKKLMQLPHSSYRSWGSHAGRTEPQDRRHIGHAGLLSSLPGWPAACRDDTPETSLGETPVVGCGGAWRPR
jgi:hypothetical protein